MCHIKIRRAVLDYESAQFDPQQAAHYRHCKELRTDVVLMCPFVLSQCTPLRRLINEQAAKTTPATVIHHGTCDLSPQCHWLFSLCPSSPSVDTQECEILKPHSGLN